MTDTLYFTLHLNFAFQKLSLSQSFTTKTLLFHLQPLIFSIRAVLSKSLEAAVIPQVKVVQTFGTQCQWLVTDSHLTFNLIISIDSQSFHLHFSPIKSSLSFVPFFSFLSCLNSFIKNHFFLLPPADTKYFALFFVYFRIKLSRRRQTFATASISRAASKS